VSYFEPDTGSIPAPRLFHAHYGLSAAPLPSADVAGTPHPANY
jgi:hypothetical protein